MCVLLFCANRQYIFFRDYFKGKREENALCNTNENGIKLISILRLDMDWYKPTKIALDKFYNKIQKSTIGRGERPHFEF